MAREGRGVMGKNPEHTILRLPHQQHFNIMDRESKRRHIFISHHHADDAEVNNLLPSQCRIRHKAEEDS